MHVLLVGTGGVGTCIAKLAAQRDPHSEWLEKMILADCDVLRAGRGRRRRARWPSASAGTRQSRSDWMPVT